MSDIAFWSALGAAISGGIVVLIIEWVRWFIDRPLVKVRASLGLRIQGQNATWLIFIEAINPHSKSVTLSSAGFTFRGRKPHRVKL